MALYMPQQKQQSGGLLQNLLSIFMKGGMGGSGGNDAAGAMDFIEQILKSGGNNEYSSLAKVGLDVAGQGPENDTAIGEAMKYGQAGSILGPWGAGAGSIYGFGKGSDWW